MPTNPRTQAEIGAVYQQLEKGEIVWSEFLRITQEHSTKAEPGEPPQIHNLNIQGSAKQGGIKKDGSSIPVTDAIKDICAEQEGITSRQITDAFDKVQTHYNRKIESLRMAFPPQTDFALYMEELLSSDKGAQLRFLKWKWNYVETRLHQRIRSQTSDIMVDKIKSFQLRKSAPKADVKAHLALVAKFYGETSEVNLTKFQQLLTDTKHPALTQVIANSTAPDSIAELSKYVRTLHDALNMYVFSTKRTVAESSLPCRDHFRILGGTGCAAAVQCPRSHLHQHLHCYNHLNTGRCHGQCPYAHEPAFKGVLQRALKEYRSRQNRDRDEYGRDRKRGRSPGRR